MQIADRSILFSGEGESRSTRKVARALLRNCLLAVHTTGSTHIVECSRGLVLVRLNDDDGTDDKK